MPIRISRRRRLWAALSFAAVLILAGCGRETRDAALVPGDDAAFACGQPARAIASLPRGDDGDDPEPAASIDVEGVVVGDFQAGLGGFFLHSLAGDDDGDERTPEGLFVELRQSRHDASTGQHLRLRGIWTAPADTRHGRALTAIAQVAVCGQTELPPATVVTRPPADWQSHEGMRVYLPGPLTVTGNYGLLRFGEMQVSFGERLFAATETAPPGAEAGRIADDNARRQLLIDDGRGDEYPRHLWHLPQAPGAAAPWRTGSLVAGIEGVIEYRHGAWRLQPTRAIERAEQAARPAPPARAPDRVRVAAFNLLNFFNGDGRGGGFPTERGAASEAAMQRQRDKLVAAMRALDADVIGLMEIENDGAGPDSAIAELVAALNDHGDRWTAVAGDDDRLGADAIAVGLIYRGDRVATVGAARTLTGGPFDHTSRVPLAQGFVAIDGGSPFLVAVNHFKSKGGCDQAGDGDHDQGDGQACYNATRVDSALRLADWLQTDPTGIGAEASLVLGDLNAYGREDPVRLLADRGFVDLVTQAGDGTPTYTYVFRGQSGRLDHALGGSALAARLRGGGVWHANADELPEFAYDGDAGGRRLYAPDPWRSSDHDPLWIDLRP